jgi:hypothetical protein
MTRGSLGAREAVLLASRLGALVALTFWLGGFTFYSATVLPILHDELGSLEAGRLTGQVAFALNGYGVAAVVTWWILAVQERALGGRWPRRLRWGLLGVTTAILAGLIALHPVVSMRLEAGSMREFRTLHLVYLNASTVQWGVNLAVLAVSVWIWRGVDSQMCTDSPSP